MKPKGLYLRNEVWHIDKVVAGTRIQRSAHTKNLAEASEIVRQIETAALSRNASAEWSQVVEEMMSDKGSWLWKTIQRINKPSVTKSKGHSTVNPETLRLLLLRSDGKCELTGIPFSMEIPKGSKTPPYWVSLDRIDSACGYHMENCRVVCLAVNLAMREWGESVMVRIGQAMMLKHLQSQILGEVPQKGRFKKKGARPN